MIGSLLGHRQVSTTARYAHLDDTSLLEAATEIGDEIACRLALSEAPWRQ